MQDGRGKMIEDGAGSVGVGQSDWVGNLQSDTFSRWPPVRNEVDGAAWLAKGNDDCFEAIQEKKSAVKPLWTNVSDLRPIEKRPLDGMAGVLAALCSRTIGKPLHGDVRKTRVKS